MKKIFFTSDHHFGHGNIIKYASRPFTSVEEMNRTMITRWNEVVGPNDLVYYLGDFAFLKEESIAKILSQLNGYIILIRGNHDLNAKTMLRLGFKEVYNQKIISLGKFTVLLDHYPYRPKNLNHQIPLKKLNRRPLDKGHWLIHGHVHNYYTQRGKMINVSVERWDFRPVNAETLISLMEAGPVATNLETSFPEY